MKTKHYLTFLTLFLILQSPLKAQYSNPEAGIEPVAEDDIWAKTLDGSHYNEMWNYQFYLNDGMTVHIAFSVANFGSFKDPISGVQMSIYNLDGELHQVSREYPIHYLIQDREKNIFRLRDERTIYFEGKLPNQHRVHVEFTKHDVYYNVQLDFSNIHEGIKWGDGDYRIGSENVGIITHIPYADVRGTVQVDNVERKVRGTAYMDHTYQDRATTDIIDSGYRFVHQENRQNWDLLYYLLPTNSSQNRTVGYRLTNEDGKISINGIEQIARMNSAEAFGIEFARIMDMRMQGNSEIRVSRTDDFEKFSILSELGWLARKAAKSFLGGEVISLRGEAVLMEEGNRPKRGYYNFYIID
jgi:hypothetical protein